MSALTPSPLTDLSRLCVHTMTTRSLTLSQCIEHYQEAGIPQITVWRQAFADVGAREAGKMLRASGLNVVSLCRGGFFPAFTAEKRLQSLEDNRRAIDEAFEIGAPLIVLVCGADPTISLADNRAQIEDGIRAISDEADAAGIRLAIEPLHPMYADTRSAINTLKQATDLAERIGRANVGVTVDVFHVWWDPELSGEIARCGRAGRLFSFHVCDWRVPTRDMLNDRGLMGDGCIDVPNIRAQVEATGFNGPIEVEIFSNEYWELDQRKWLGMITSAYLQHT